MIAALILAGALTPLRALEGQTLRLYRQQGLQFGIMVVEPGGGSVELTPEGQLKPSGGLRPLGGTLAMVGRIAVEGPARQRFQVELDPPRPTLAGAAGTPRIERFIILSGTGSLTLDGEGRAEVRIGAVLDVPAGSFYGAYRALPDVQVRVRLADRGTDGGVSAPLYLPIQATLRSPLSLNCQRSLFFGDLVPGPGGGALRVAPDGSFHWAGSEPAQFLRQRPVAARFRLQGASGSGYCLRLPRQEILLTGAKGSLPVKDFTADAPLEGRIPPGGLDFGVGATLTLPPSAVSGAYSGTFRVEVLYN
jgi:hypothetical protein